VTTEWSAISGVVGGWLPPQSAGRATPERPLHTGVTLRDPGDELLITQWLDPAGQHTSFVAFDLVEDGRFSYYELNFELTFGCHMPLLAPPASPPQLDMRLYDRVAGFPELLHLTQQAATPLNYVVQQHTRTPQSHAARTSTFLIELDGQAPTSTCTEAHLRVRLEDVRPMP